MGIIILATISCASNKNTAESGVNATEPFVIYKTKADYNNLVPVMLNNDKTQIVSYPAPSDVYHNGELAVPIELLNGYLLDNRGISKNVAFTSYTYSEYSKLDSIPSVSELFERIVDNDPLRELYDCRSQIKIKSDIDKIEKMIKRGFKNCERIK